jgi:hypothetical protein
MAACLGQACFLFDDCGEGPMPTALPANTPPIISGLRVNPLEMIAGGRPADVSATITDHDGNLLSWSLTVGSSSQATGTFSPPDGSSGTVQSRFSPAPTSSGSATLRLSAVDRGGGTAQAEITVFVIAPSRR